MSERDRTTWYNGKVRRLGALVFLCALGGCGYREPVPAFQAQDARFGRLGGHGDAPELSAMCRHWPSAIVSRDEYAISHVSFPESDVQSACFPPVTHRRHAVRARPA